MSLHSRLLSAVRRNLNSSSAPVVHKVDRAIISYPLNTLYQVDNSGTLRPGSKSLIVFMHSFQKLWLKTFTMDDIW